jgi:protocatechuate 3,4-dioxygenase beta subunit
MKPYVEHDDDIPVGRVLSRRETLALLGGAGAVVILGGCAPGTSSTAKSAATSTGTASSSLPACVARPALTEGPYFVDERLNRSDIWLDPSDNSIKAGAPLRLEFRVSQLSNACTPLSGATVDVWQCDALGIYSDVSDPGFNTVGRKFLRGYQVTDANGAAQFTTIYPGWYQGRTVHIHFKIRTTSGTGSTHQFTSQLFFDDSLTDQVHRQTPYASKGQRTVRNNGDSIFLSGGNQLLLRLTPDGQGYATTFDIGLQIA